MKATKIASLLVIALAFTIVGTGCQKKPVRVTDIKDRQTRVGDSGTPGGTPIDFGPGGVSGIPGEGTPLNPKGWIASGDYTVDAGTLAAQTVHFDYDSSVVKSSEQGNVDAVVAHLKGNANVGLRIDGYCDERGTEGYNDALGDRRALALRDAVLALGVESDRVITQSFGEQNPVALGQDEAAYKQNRRGEFMILQPK